MTGEVQSFGAVAVSSCVQFLGPDRFRLLGWTAISAMTDRSVTNPGSGHWQKKHARSRIYNHRSQKPLLPARLAADALTADRTVCHPPPCGQFAFFWLPISFQMLRFCLGGSYNQVTRKLYRGGRSQLVAFCGWMVQAPLRQRFCSFVVRTSRPTHHKQGHCGWS